MAGLTRLGAVLPSLARRLSSALRFEPAAAATGCRAYGTAAALAVDYDNYDYEDDEIEDLRRGGAGKAMADSEVSQPGRGLQWVVIGEPGANKHLYADWLSKLLNVPLISLGTLVRQELSPRSSLYKQIADSVNQGKLVQEDIIFRLLSKRLEEGYFRGENGFILEGIPRTRLQAEILDEIADIDLVLNFKWKEESLRQVQLGNRLKFQFLNNQISTLRSKEEAAWKEKLIAYTEQSKPVEDYYRYQKKLLDFKVADAPGETWQGLLAALHLQHLNFPASSQTLTA